MARRSPAELQLALTDSEARFHFLLGISRRLASEADARALLTALLDEAVAFLQADAGTVHRWDEQRNGLVVVCNTLLRGGEPVVVPIGQGAVGQAVLRRAPVVIADYQRASNVLPAAKLVGARSALAVPLLHQNRLLGALGVFSLQPARRFGAADVESLELLGGMAAAALVGVERARLGGALLAARTAQHDLNNRLTVLMGYADWLNRNPALPPELQEVAGGAVRCIQDAVEILDKLARVSQLNELDWGPDLPPTLDLGQS
jgi:GAF domain-containing protein